ncbi:Bacterial alpha-L-rhamnosidase [Bifidobacterium tissieri]|uniref:alpha-L-rhamnosidase n=1 Tax=Bifidobacterium tissieri TaxID=1630162 RepID=A0A261FG52_9BIFI|nr:alpha-L-rhamnosidase N-terminal domain-containing protein [Bifidobacterium tissieri]OZG58114.1 Bacterial alpha-L-rhamnosidase [Bifidobacterium tissieri]
MTTPAHADTTAVNTTVSATANTTTQESADTPGTGSPSLGHIHVGHIRVNDRIEPVDLMSGTPVTVRWWVDDATADATADGGIDTEPSSPSEWTHWQIIVTDRPGGGITVWDSGRQPYDGTVSVTLDGFELPVSSRYWLEVRVWDGHGHVSPWSDPVTFGSGAGDRWQAVPIWVPADAPADGVVDESAEFNLPDEETAPTDDSFFVGNTKAADPHNSRGWAFLRGEVTLPDKPVRWATLNVTASSTRAARQFVHRSWVNGSFVGYGPVFPIANEARYDGYDVTALLRPGRNAIGALAYTVEDQRYLAQLDVMFDDGTTARFGTGENWRALPGTTIYPDSASVGTQYFEAPAENVQAANYPFGFSEPGFDDAAWSPAAVRESFAALAPTPTDKPEVQYHAPAAIRTTDDGHLVLDFGRTWEGGVRITQAVPDTDHGTSQTESAQGNAQENVHGNARPTLRIRYGEVLNADGSVKYHLSAFNTYEDIWHLTGDTASMETWGLRVFRYVEIIPANDDASRALLRRLADGGNTSIEAAALVYPFDRSAAFSSSDATLNTVWAFCRNTMESTNGNIYADSWTRERAPYEGDAWLQQQAHLICDDAPALAEYSVDWLIANRTWPTEWPLYLILAAHDAWMRTGSMRQIATHYDQLVALLPLGHFDEESGLIVKDPGESSVTDGDLIDWPPVERDGFEFGRVNTVINALSSQTFADMADIARALGRGEDADRFRHIADRMRAAIHDRLYDAEAGAYIDGLTDGADGERIGHHSLHASAFALAFAQVPRDRIAAVGAFLRGKGMACSVYAASVYLTGLYQVGLGADANALIAAHDGLRTWMNMIDKGAGATMEAWDVELKPNTTYSHPWAASPAFLLPEGLLGIRPTSPGYATFTVKPQLGEPGKRGSVDQARAVVPTVRGPIVVDAARVALDDAGVRYGLRVDIDVPAHATAYLKSPHGVTTGGGLGYGHHTVML